MLYFIERITDKTFLSYDQASGVYHSTQVNKETSRFDNIHQAEEGLSYYCGISGNDINDYRIVQD